MSQPIPYNGLNDATSRRYTGYPLYSTSVSSCTPDSIGSIITHAATGRPSSTAVWIRISRVEIQISAQDPQIAQTRIPTFVPIGLVHDIFMSPSINNIICIVYDEVKSNMKGVLLYVVQPADAQSIRNDFHIVKRANIAQSPSLSPPPSIYPTQTDNRYSNVNQIYPSQNSRIHTPISSRASPLPNNIDPSKNSRTHTPISSRASPLSNDIYPSKNSRTHTPIPSRESPLPNDIHRTNQPIQQASPQRVPHTRDSEITFNHNSFNPPLSKQSTSPLPVINSQQNEQSNSAISSKPLEDVSPIISSSGDKIDLALPTKAFKATKKSVNDLSQAACTYVWFRRMKEIFLVMGKQNDAFTRFDMDLARTDMIQTCEQYLESERPKLGGSNLSELDQAKLDRWKNKQLYAELFRMSYFRKDANSDEKTIKTLTQTELARGEVPNFDNAIWWYSCNEAPIYDQMNNILRLENFELLMCHRYYISDLCQMIEQSYAQNKPSKKLLVYRADKLNREDFYILEESIKHKDSIITINGFISTTRDEKISLEYAAAKLKQGGNDVVIMYEITIDPAIQCSAFADIESISFHPREREVLFNMGSVFKVDAIVDDPINSKIKRIKVTASDFNLTALDEMKVKVKQSSQAFLSILLVRYLIELGEDRVSERYLNQIIDSKQLENDPNLVAVYNCLGIIHSHQALYGEALEYYRKALNTQARLQFSNNNALAEIFNNIGQTHLRFNQLDEAQQNLEEGIRIQKREPKYSHQHLAALYCNMGQVDYARRSYDEAQKNFQLSYDLYNRSKKNSYDALEKLLLKADLCIAFGHLKSAQNPKDPTEANDKFEEAQKIYESILPTSHPKVTETYINIVYEYARNKNFQSVTKYYDENATHFSEDYENKQTTSQQDLANFYAIIGACFAYEKKFDRAMEIWKKSLKHKEKSFLDELLSSVRVSKIVLPIRLVETAYRIALEHYSTSSNAPKEYLGILYTTKCTYDEAIDHLRGQNSYLLANLYVLQRKFEKSMIVYKRIPQGTDCDLTSPVGVLLGILTAKKITSNEEPIAELIRIAKLLANKVADNEAIRLRIIITDYLAETYLSMKKYDKALKWSRISFDLKQRHYSSDHSSLVRNFQLEASCNFQRGDYKTALQYYVKIGALLRNMPSGHTDVLSNYFLMGDCYCQMDKIELANEFYDQAQSSNDTDTDEDKEAKRDVKALIRMHSNLAKVFAKQNNFSSATFHQQEKIDLFAEILPAFVIDQIEDASSISFDHLRTILITRLGLTNGKTLAQVLRNCVFIYFSLARALLSHDDRSTDDDEDSTDLYEQAIELELKLTMFEKVGEKRLQLLYKELGNTYEKLYTSMKKTSKENFIKALDETTDANHQRPLEFRLGNLCLDEKEYSEATDFWKRASKKLPDSQTTVKAILDKLIEKNESNISRSSEEDTDDDDVAEEESDKAENDIEESDKEERNKEESNEETIAANEENKHNRNHSPSPSVNSQRRQSIKSTKSTKSTNDKEKLEELAQAYLDLEDDENALKYFQKHVLTLEDLLKPTWLNTTIKNKNVSMIKFFHSLLLQIITLAKPSSSKSEAVSNKDAWTNLLQTYMKIFPIAVRLDSSPNEIAKANLATFQICQKLYGIPSNLFKVYDLLFNGDPDDLQWKELIDLLSSDESIDILMRIAAYYVSKENYDKSLEIYCFLQNKIQTQETAKSAVNYAILKLFQRFLAVDEQYRTNIMTIDIQSPNIPIFDRIRLCRLIISFWEEMEDETTTVQFKKELLNLQNTAWTVGDLETTNCIGHILTKVEDNALTCLYWDEIRYIYNEMFSDSMVTLLYSTNSTFEQIFQTAQEMNNDISDNIISLAESYELLATYIENDSGSDGGAHKARTKSNMIWSKIRSANKEFTKS